MGQELGEGDIKISTSVSKSNREVVSIPKTWSRESQQQNRQSHLRPLYTDCPVSWHTCPKIRETCKDRQHTWENEAWPVGTESSASVREKKREPGRTEHRSLYFKFLSPQTSSFKVDPGASFRMYSFLMASFVSSTSESIFLSLCVPCFARGICWLTSTFSFNSLFGVVLLLLFLPFNSAFQLFSPVFHRAVLCMGPLCGGEWPDWSLCECSAGAKPMAPNRFFLLTSPCFRSLEPRSYLSDAVPQVTPLFSPLFSSEFGLLYPNHPAFPLCRLLSPATPMQIHFQGMWPFRQHGYHYPYRLIRL